MHEALHVLRCPELAARVVEPGYDQGTEQGIVRSLYFIIADTVEQCAIDKFRTYQPELALTQACKHIVVCHGLVVELKKRHTPQVFFYPPVSSLDEHGYLLCVTTTAYHLDTLPFSMQLPHYAHGRTTRLVQLLLDKHATKIAIFLHTGPGKAIFSGGNRHKFAATALAR